MRVYVASSWRNEEQLTVVARLRCDGHMVYNFKNSEGFHWSEIDKDWKDWISDIPKYLDGLKHPKAERGFSCDMNALINCDACVYVMPGGISASLEAGWAVGAGKRVFVYIPRLHEPELMVKMAELVTDDLEVILAELRSLKTPSR